MTETERPSCDACGWPLGQHAPNCPTRRELVPELRDLVWTENGLAVEDGRFFVYDADPSVPADLLRPILARGEGDGTRIALKEIPTMGKAAFMERTLEADGVTYRFVQWKGVGANRANDRMNDAARDQGGSLSYPLGERGAAPLFYMDVFGKKILRFKGGAFYEDLLHEAKKSEEFAAYGLRMPKILGTIKFSREFCRENGLPLPDDDRADNADGETMRAFLESHRSEIDPELFEKLASAQELTAGYASAVLGENVRAFRNVWRVDDLERVMAEPASDARTHKLAAIVDASARILSEEAERDLSREEFLRAFVTRLGAQAAILVENRLNQGALLNIKQDVTLAAELCDFDNGYRLDDGYLRDPANVPKWVTDDATRAEWQREQEAGVDRQILLLAAHIRPLADAISDLRNRPVDGTKVTDLYVASLLERLPDEARSALRNRVAASPDFGSVEAIAGSDLLTRKNLEGCQEWFDRIVARISESK